jgi:hypothetical protein
MLYVGIDWADEHHDVCFTDNTATTLAQLAAPPIAALGRSTRAWDAPISYRRKPLMRTGTLARRALSR